MRVISGKYRGKRLISPQGSEVRPTSDKVKESIFNVIQFDVENSRFLDLFSGSGAMGIEALSRGAREALFADCSRTSAELTQSNLKGVSENYKVVCRDFRDALYSAEGKWDFIFVDPPYGSDYIQEICRIARQRDMLADGGYIIYERNVDKAYKLPDGMCVKKRKIFGSTCVDYIAVSRGKTAIAGSYDPITTGHLDIIDKALETYDEVTVLIAKNPDKEYLFSTEERAEFIRAAVSDYLNVNVDICDGLVCDYCKAHGIDTVYRGYRSAEDLAYEKDMAEFNKARGLETVLVEGLRPISSTLIREGLASGSNVKKYLPKQAANAIMRAYKEKL